MAEPPEPRGADSMGPRPAPPPPHPASDQPYGAIIDRFRGTEWETPPPPPPPNSPGGALSGGVMVGLGLAVLVVAVALVAVAVQPPSPAQTPPASHVVYTPPPTPGPGDLVLAAFWRQIQAPVLDYHVAIEGSAKVGSSSGSQQLSLDVYGDDYQGSLVEKFKSDGTYRYVLLSRDGVLYIRKASETRWSKATAANQIGLSPRPFLGLEDDRQLAYAGTTEQDGVTLHRLASTALYRPGVDRILPIVVAPFPNATVSLELLVTADGVPVQASFTCHATLDLENLQPALDGTVTYRFSSVGAVAPIPTPKL